MEVPEKIWIAVYGKDLSYEWHSDSEFEAKDHNDIEYTRTDAFIERACAWLYIQLNEINMEGKDMENFLKDFENYMKGG